MFSCLLPVEDLSVGRVGRSVAVVAGDLGVHVPSSQAVGEGHLLGDTVFALKMCRLLRRKVVRHGEPP